ncbi:TSUP family transporter [Nesterenkonia sp. F]|uniref:TSUP family transporter n=1 Tax=Nesterenkonia sp. F TaxID=795955 RepID=UPI000255C8F8|nr:TSUP family transporter [Nesterenkonia sp. F]
MTTLTLVLAIVAAVLLGTVLQRVSGTGVGLVVSPVLSILLGPALGVLITNMTTVVSGALIMAAVWSRISWRRFAVILPAAVVGAVPAAWMVGAVDAGWLSILVGVIVVCALLVAVSLPRLPEWSSTSSRLTAGLLGGFFNTACGVAAPVMVIHAKLSRWEQGSFSATLQPIFLSMGLTSVVVKLMMGSVPLDDAVGVAPALLASATVVTVLAGVLIGGRAAQAVTPTTARRVAVTLAGLGGVGAILRGVLDLAG